MPAGETPGLPPDLDLLSGIEDVVPAGLARAVREVPLVDHHVHGAFTADVERSAFEYALVEASTDPVPAWDSAFATPLGLSLRRWCAPLLGLPAHAGGEEYWEARSALGADELARRFTSAAGVERWVVDTGFSGGSVQSPTALAGTGGGTWSEIVRLEPMVERVVAEVAPADVADEVRTRLAAATAGPEQVGVKSIAAYRCGFDIDWSRPTDAAVAAAASALAAATPDGETPRVADPVLIAFAVHEAAALGLPIQLHVGFGDRDLDLHRTDPLLLLPLLRTVTVPVLLLHCYPFHRQAAYLAQAFDHVSFDIGLAINYLGPRSVELVGEAMELAPFAKQLYSSDAFGPPELHFLGSVLWRRGMAVTLGTWLRRGDCSEADAVDALHAIAGRNARRVYGLPG
ncbi:amidohydrolase family protein [Nocardioides sp. GY 10127]|uniref:amidohydrolase family protein n=1 Tax=Nocardioides sp. GY 10127 TaxID=2569762 RepID=UPI0010A8DA11|nr:amidohydrolase family protein [Nocardioides sp. GY 10127]TIC79278.1 amidohydrolase [Nocardioides sp. GY 10127]